MDKGPGILDLWQNSLALMSVFGKALKSLNSLCAYPFIFRSWQSFTSFVCMYALNVNVRMEASLLSLKTIAHMFFYFVSTFVFSILESFNCMYARLARLCKNGSQSLPLKTIA